MLGRSLVYLHHGVVDFTRPCQAADPQAPCRTRDRGRPLTDLRRLVAYDHWRSCVGDERPFTAECRLQHVNGGWRWTHVRAVPLRDDAGKGSEMTVRLPLAGRGQQRTEEEAEFSAPAAAPDRQEPAQSNSADTDAQSRRILAVDDDADIAETLTVALEMTGHQVRQAQTAAKALTTADDFAPEVVILDIGLPDMDGYALANALRARPQTAEALLIAVSGYGQDSDIDKSRVAGIDHHLTKPARLDMLLELIGRRRAATRSR
jgi:CheY-like chemotaxis protein